MRRRVWQIEEEWDRRGQQPSGRNVGYMDYCRAAWCLSLSSASRLRRKVAPMVIVRLAAPGLRRSG